MNKHKAGGDQRALRFYGVVHADSIEREAADAQGVETVSYRDLAAVVARAPYVRTQPGDEELADYVRVVDALGANGPVIPAPPGTVFRDERVLARWLDVHYAKLHETLGTIATRGVPGAPYDFVRMELGG